MAIKGRETSLFRFKGSSVISILTGEKKDLSETQIIGLEFLPDSEINSLMFLFFEHKTMNEDEAIEDMINNVNFDI